MYILGLSAFYHDSAACLIKDGHIVAAAQEERFVRVKHYSGFPKHAIDYCLKAAGIAVNDLEYVGFYDKPFVKFERIIESYLTYVPSGINSFIKAIPIWLKQKIFLRDLIRRELGYTGRIIFAEHHQSHAASAFFPSPFEEAAIITADGVGEWTTTSYGIGQGNSFNILSQIKFPHSLGLLYSAFTFYTGFEVNADEYKVMGLAPYGEPKYKDLILKELIDLKSDGSFKLNMKYFNYCAGVTMTNEHFNQLFGGPPRREGEPIRQKDMDLARSIQAVTEEVMLRIVNHVYKTTEQKKLCLAGGVALNCVANGRILREGPFEEIWIQPAAGDAGGALGVALFIWYSLLGNQRDVDNINDQQQGSLLGPSFSDEEIESYLVEQGIPYEKFSEQGLFQRTSELIEQGNVIGWFQTRMEFGPRALGARSIIADARSRDMQSIINRKIKFRESFRPFAPTVLRECTSDYFDIDKESPYMLMTAPVKEERRFQLSPDEENLFGLEKLKVTRSQIPAVTHVDYSARIQTIAPTYNPRFYHLIKTFYQMTDCPLIVNTSFNVRGQPIVCTPEDAYRCFMYTDMNYLVMGRCLIDKAKQADIGNRHKWKPEPLISIEQGFWTDIKPCLDIPQIKRLGILLTIVLSGWWIWHLLVKGQFQVWSIILSLLFFISSIFKPVLIKPVCFFIILLTRLIGWFNTKILLAIVYYLVFTPIGFILRVVNRDALLDIKFDRQDTSYWQSYPVAPQDITYYQRQF